MITDLKHINYNTKHQTKSKDNISTNTEIAEILDYILIQIAGLEKLVNAKISIHIPVRE